MAVDTRVAPHLPRLRRLCRELDKRCARYRRIEPYLGDCQNDLDGLPAAITEARLTKVYRNLMPVADAPWGAEIVQAKLDRLELAGLLDGKNPANAQAVWDQLQANGIASESKLAHHAALANGRAFALVWPMPDRQAEVSLDDATQMIVEYAEGSRRKRTAAMRRWRDADNEGRQYATLYGPEEIFKFQGPAGSAGGIDNDSIAWEVRTEGDEPWPLPNWSAPNIPVAELAVNRRLKPGQFGYARGEFEHCLGLIDRINLLTFLGLVVAFWMGFPLRGVIGEKIRREVLVDDDGAPILDDDGGQQTRPIPIIEAKPDSVFQLTNEQAKIAQFDAADRKNLGIFPELDQLSTITATPRHYFPLEGGMQNLSAEAIMASEGGMHAAVYGHQAFLGEGHLDIGRLVGQAIGKPLSPNATVQWRPAEARSLAEKADAASKLKDGLPWVAIAEIVGLGGQDDINRWLASAASDPLNQIVASLAANGNGNGAVPSGLPTG